MYKFFKRAFDLILSFTILCTIAPIMIPIMIGLKFTGEGHIFYKQERVGYKTKLFGILKFATMLLDSPNMDGGVLTTKKDPRITPMGGFLRKSKINELPQLLNIFKGEMSFVGPRPVMEISFSQYPEHVKEVIYNVQPGLTGIGSIVFRDEEELISDCKARGDDPWKLYTEEIYPYKGELEKWYQAHQSFMLDMSIVFCTAWVIVFPSSDLIFRWYPDLPTR